MRYFISAIFIISLAASSVWAQSEAELKRFFEGTQIKLRIDMPDTEGGVNIYPERSQTLNYTEYTERLKSNEIAFHRNEATVITKVRVKDKHIEIQLAAADCTAKRVSRFNVHFSRMESLMLNPATVVDALRRYVEFTDADTGALRQQPNSSYIRRGVVQLGPRETYLREGLKTQEVLQLLGEPANVSERMNDGNKIAVYEFQRGEGRVLIAVFMDGQLISSRTETSTARVGF